MSFASTLALPKVIRNRLPLQKSGWIGIDIGSSAIKLAQIQKIDTSWKLLNHKTIPLCLEGDQPDTVSAATQVIQQQPALFSMFAGKQAACLLPMSVVDLQSMKLPDGSDDELHAMIKQELESLNDSQNDKLEFVFWKENFSFNRQEGMTALSVMTTPQQNVLAIAKQLLKSARHCQVMDVLPFALARAIRMVSSFSADAPVAAFDWGSATPLFVIVKDGAPIYSRVFRNCGFSNCTQLLRDKLGLTLQESMHLLKGYQAKNSKDTSTGTVRESVSDLVAAPLKRLAREFGKTLEFIKHQRRDLMPEHLWLFGVGASLYSVTDFVTEMTGVQSEIWNLSPLTNQRDTEQAVIQANLGPAIALSALAYEV